LLKFVLTFGALSCVLIFSIVMLYLSKTCEDTQMYLSLLMFLIGLLIPVSK
jgi:hypothetical protein